VVIVLLRRVVAAWYTRKRTSEETHLEKLKTVQKQKVGAQAKDRLLLDA